jgi:hypothetical protein
MAESRGGSGGETELDVFTIERLLEGFATAALGLQLKDRIEEKSTVSGS